MALTPQQTSLLDQWLGQWRVSEDVSWPLQDTTVLRVECSAGSRVVKASLTSHHIRREIVAHDLVLLRLDDPRFPCLRHADLDAGVLVTDWLPGSLVAGTADEHDPDLYRRAGEALAVLHGQAQTSQEYLAAARAKIAGLIDTASARRLADENALAVVHRWVYECPTHPVEVRFTHGDYHPRNWLTDAGTLRVIDFGRAAWRPVESDFIRLLHQQFVGRPDLTDAFFEGYGRPLASFDAGILQVEHLMQSLATIVWANQVGDVPFEEQGRHMLRRALDDV